jgi:hypothetical protein
METNMNARFRRVVALVLLTLATLAGLPKHAGAQSISYGDWFNLDQTLAGDWAISGSGDSTRSLTLYRSSEGLGAARRHVFVLYSRNCSTRCEHGLA